MAVAARVAARAIRILRCSAPRISSFPRRLAYHFHVNPRQTAVSLDSLKEKVTSTSKGRYKKM